MRPEGFEPPAYCSVAAFGVSSHCDQGEHDACIYWCDCSCHLDALPEHEELATDLRTMPSFCPVCGCENYIGHGCEGSQPLDDLLLNPPCPVCGAPLVWGVCAHPHAGDLALAA